MILLDYFRLKFGDAAARQQAIESLSSAANRRILKWLINKWLISALKDPEVWVRYEAARVVGTHRDAIAVNPLLAALCDPEVIVREIVVGSLGRIGTPKAVETVLSALELDPSEKVRARACTALGQIADERFVGPLSRAAQDPRGDVQWQAFEALEKIGKPSVDALIGLIENDEAEVRWRAAYTLGKIQDERGVPPIVGRLRDRQLRVR